MLLLCFYIDHRYVAADLPHDCAHIRHKRKRIPAGAQFEGSPGSAGDIDRGTDLPPEAVVFDVAHYTHDLPPGSGCAIRVFTRIRSVIAEGLPQRVAFREICADE